MGPRDPSATALLIVTGLVAAIARRAPSRQGACRELHSLAPIGAVVATLLLATMLARICGVLESVREALRAVSLAGPSVDPVASLSTAA